MSIEFIGIAATAPHSETEVAASQSDPVQPGYLEELARAHEEAAFGHRGRDPAVLRRRVPGGHQRRRSARGRVHALG